MNAAATPPAVHPEGLRPLVFTPWYPPETGGVASVSERLHHGLRAIGIDSQLLVPGGGPDIAPHPNAPGVWNMEIPTAFVTTERPRAWLGALWRGPGTIRRLVGFIREHRINRLVVVYPVDHAWVFPVVGRLAGVKLFPSLHGGDVNRAPDQSARMRWIFRRLVQASEGIIVCADHLEEKTRERCPDIRVPIVVIPNAVNVDHFVPSREGRRRAGVPPTILHVSNFSPTKRVVDIVDAFARAELPAGTRLVMVGDGVERSAAEARAEKLGVEDRVDFPGPQQDVRPFLQDAEVIVLASDSEGAPLVLLEAMACGTPWVSTAWGAAADIPSGECGLVVPPRDPDSLAAALTEIMADEKRRAQMGARGRERAVANYDARAWVRRHVEFMGGELPAAPWTTGGPATTEAETGSRFRSGS